MVTLMGLIVTRRILTMVVIRTSMDADDVGKDDDDVKDNGDDAKQNLEC